jgi:hypothetical protein
VKLAVLESAVPSETWIIKYGKAANYNISALSLFYEDIGVISMDVPDICPYSLGTHAHRLLVNDAIQSL